MADVEEAMHVVITRDDITELPAVCTSSSGYSYSYAYDDDFAPDISSYDCMDDNYSTDEYEDSCSEWYDDNPGDCGG